MIRRLWSQILVGAVLVSVMSACSEGGDADPYATVTLRQATRETVVSKGFKYKIVQPEIVALHRNLGLIREGNLIEFIGARSLEDKCSGMLDGYFELDVIKKFSPIVHFNVEKIATETDTVFFTAGRSLVMPKVWAPGEYGTESYEETDINTIPWNNTGALKGLVDKKMLVSGKITMEKEEDRTYYVLHGEKAKFKIADSAEGTSLILKVLTEKNYVFEGGVKFTAVEDFGSRRKTHVAGTLEIQFVNYGTSTITG